MKRLTNPNATTMLDENVVALLEREALRINSPEFIVDDPVQFPRQFETLPDIEIAALLSATIAWGNRQMICRDCHKMLSLMDYQPYNYVMERGYDDLPAKRFNIHRTFFSDDFACMLRGLRLVYTRYGSLDSFIHSCGADTSEVPAWHFARTLTEVFRETASGQAVARCLPPNTGKSALKRINMALRWLVRDDGIVDLGVWRSLRPSQLFIPLDVHVGNTARTLGLLNRKSNDRKAAENLTATLRRIRPEDPVWFDFALFGIGIGQRYTGSQVLL